jgi:hypothetical protein
VLGVPWILPSILRLFDVSEVDDIGSECKVSFGHWERMQGVFRTLGANARCLSDIISHSRSAIGIHDFAGVESPNM